MLAPRGSQKGVTRVVAQGVKVALIAWGVVSVLGALSGSAAAAEPETLQHIREFCAVRFPDVASKQSACEERETAAARKLFDRIEDFERNSPAYSASQVCIERSRLKKHEKTAEQKKAVNWTRALECIETYLKNSGAIPAR